MAIFDDEPRKKSKPHEIGQDLSLLSAGELTERIEHAAPGDRPAGGGSRSQERNQNGRRGAFPARLIGHIALRRREKPESSCPRATHTPRFESRIRMFATYRPILSLLRGTAFLLAASGLHGLLLPLRGQMEGFSTASLGLMGTAWAGGFVTGCFFAPRHRAPRRPCARLRRLRRGRRHRRAAQRPDHRRVCLDPAARLHRLHHGRRLHGHRELAEREGDQREPRHGLRPLHDGHLRLDHGRPDDRRGRRCRQRLAVHGHRHLLLPVAASRPPSRPPPARSRCRTSRSTSRASTPIRRSPPPPAC